VDQVRRFTAEADVSDFMGQAPSIKIAAIDGNGNDVQVWRLMDCLAGEVELDGLTYQLDDSALYVVSEEYLSKLDNYVRRIPTIPERLPSAIVDEREEDYNERLARAVRGLLLDQQNVTRAGATAVELCDVATPGRIAIHAKRGTGSSTLSHLFAQGVVSAELLRMDAEFRGKAQAVISREAANSGRRAATYRWLYDTDQQPSDVMVGFLIITERSVVPGAQDLPFFSKVNLRARCEDLSRMGFKRGLSLV
jgi:uncharacterized protein (TIGR04141 family)